MSSTQDDSASRRRRGAWLRRRRRRRLILWSAAAVLLVLALALTVLLWPRGPVGWWDVDEYTSYRFRRNGAGTLLVPAGEYDFTWTEEDGELTIDFADEAATDAEYRFTREKGVLTLTRPDGRSYPMTKHKK